jgi:hypothetical protein
MQQLLVVGDGLTSVMRCVGGDAVARTHMPRQLATCEPPGNARVLGGSDEFRTGQMHVSALPCDVSHCKAFPIRFARKIIDEN